jgi:hypothetical protein
MVISFGVPAYRLRFEKGSGDIDSTYHSAERASIRLGHPPG